MAIEIDAVKLERIISQLAARMDKGKRLIGLDEPIGTIGTKQIKIGLVETDEAKNPHKDYILDKKPTKVCITEMRAEEL